MKRDVICLSGIGFSGLVPTRSIKVKRVTNFIIDETII